MQTALNALKNGEKPNPVLDFGELTKAVGFQDYYREEQRYTDTSTS